MNPSSPAKQRILQVAKWAAVVLVLLAVSGYLVYRQYPTGDPEAEVARLYELFKLQQGMSVAEIGAGKGESGLHSPAFFLVAGE